MNDNYFNDYVMNAIIKKEYLTAKQLKILEQEPIEIKINDPI